MIIVLGGIQFNGLDQVTIYLTKTLALAQHSSCMLYINPRGNQSYKSLITR
jgi:hypothetical protein